VKSGMQNLQCKETSKNSGFRNSKLESGRKKAGALNIWYLEYLGSRIDNLIMKGQNLKAGK